MKRIYLRTAREQKGLTQVAFAACAGVSQKTISRLECEAGARPSFLTQTSIAHVLDVDPESLAFGPDPKVSRDRVAS